MKDVWVVADAIASPLGNGADENFRLLQEGKSGVTVLRDNALSASPITAGQINTLKESALLTRFESMCWQVMEAVINSHRLPPEKTLFILSTTKGNISFLRNGESNHPRLSLHATAKYLADKAGFKKYLVVSNACISGVMALIAAKRFLQSGRYDHALVVGADELSRFVVSGFQSLQALSDEPCRPFDATRKGINLGEAAAAMLLTTNPGEWEEEASVRILGSGLSNDANHISGPSRTGEELCMAIAQAWQECDLSPNSIDFISAHGTATLYNDEMEAKAFTRAGLSDVPLNSLKGYYGHTLGVAGILETVISTRSLYNNVLIPTLGFKTLGVSPSVNVIQEVISKPVSTFLKTASGFGGCNAAIVLQKVNK
jgi:3-oxoacyl-[acyl-carrier-protein] synthase-1